jgi:selenophosphate synthetase-related protein
MRIACCDKTEDYNITVDEFVDLVKNCWWTKYNNNDGFVTCIKEEDRQMLVDYIEKRNYLAAVGNVIK